MFAALYVPDFALQAILRNDPELPGRPAALIEEDSPKARILQLTPAARAAGLCEGLTSTQAMARCAAVHLRPRSPAQERIAQDLLLQAASTLSPFIEDTTPGVVTLQLRTPHSGLRIPHSALLPARLGIAATPDLALLAAHHADPILCVENGRDFLSALPVSALDPSPSILAILEKWGIRTLGELSALGKDALARRLGPEALSLFDLATGNSRRVLRLVPPPETFEETLELEYEVETLEPLLFILRRFLGQLTARLDAVHLVAASLRLRLISSLESEILNHEFHIPESTCAVDTLFRMLHTHLENFTADFPIAALHLSAEPCRPSHRQFGLFETALRDPNRFHETLARLAALVGHDRVGTPQSLDTHRPDAFEMTPFHAEGAPPHSVERESRSASRCGHAALPLRRFRPPRPLDPSLRAAAQAAGPYLGSGDWWDTQSWGREEWDLASPDGTLWRAFRQQDGWFLEGLYD